MNILGRYNIPFAGLKDGVHEFNFLIDNKFFEIFDFSELREGEVDVNFTLHKKARFLQLDFDLKGQVKVTCDRCLDEFYLPVSYQTTLIVNFGNDNSEPEDSIVVIPYSETQINISQYIYEFINLSLPIRRVHPDGPDGETMCDKSMLDKIDQYLRKD